MQISEQNLNGDHQIKKLLYNIHNLTIQMSNTFQQAILRHEQQFIKTYRIKINQLTKLFEDLTKVLQDKFINNALTNRLNIVIKQRDYFKYECLKLNVQYQTILNEQNNLTSQIVNVTDQMKIYRHLLEDEKIRNKELQKNAQKFKTNFNQMAYKTLTQNMQNVNSKSLVDHKAIQKKNKRLQMTLNQLQQKNEIIRSLKIKLSQLQIVVSQKQTKYFQKKELYETFKSCMNAWKRDILTKERKNNSCLNDKKTTFNSQKLPLSSKKQLLRYLFTNTQFLLFIEKLLFHPNFKVQFTQINPDGEKFMIQNRIKLFQYMRKKRVIHSPNLIER